MKIAIVTIYDGNNFGSFLQAFALKNKIEELGHDVEFIQRMPESDVLKFYCNLRVSKNRGLILNFLAKTKRFLFNRREDKLRLNNIKKIYPFLKEARKELKIINKNNLSDIDLIICGSDEIWNFDNESIDVDFYSCINFGKNIKKIAYAMSIGTASYDSFFKHQFVIKQIKTFKNIFVRDEETKSILSKILGKELIKVCDPTLLVDKSIYIKQKRQLIKYPYILLYAYSIDASQAFIIKKFAHSKGLKIITVCNYLDIADEVIQVSPFDFANLIENAYCCYTSTFHGTIFCTLFAKRFCVFSRKPKVKDVALYMNINEHLWDGKNVDSFNKIINNIVDRKIVDKNLESIRLSNSNLFSQILKEC